MRNHFGVCGLLLGFALFWPSLCLASEASIKAATYNIARGLLLRIEKRAVAKAIGPHLDVIALQEHCGSRPQDLRFFARLLGVDNVAEHVAHAPTDPLRPSKCNETLAIVSRFPILNSGHFELPEARDVGKIALWADLLLKNGSVMRVYNTHLDNRARKGVRAETARWRQAKVLLEHLLEWQSSNPQAPVLLLGDLNSLGRYIDFWRKERTIRELSKVLSPSLKRYLPTHILGYQLDWIFFENLKLVRSAPVPVVASDHFPLVADFRLNLKETVKRFGNIESR